MKNIRHIFVILLALYSVTSFADQMNVGNGQPTDNIGIDITEFPELVVVPGYPVYYAPQLDANYFFYEGQYWVYDDDIWYQSTWFDGPWWQVDPEIVPVFVLRVPVRFYRLPPPYFQGWRPEAAPHWGEHWGHDWEQHRHGWNKWNHADHLKPAPLPDYQHEYSGDRYPRQLEQQHELHQRNYRYQPGNVAVPQHRHEQPMQNSPVQPERKPVPAGQGNTTPHTQSSQEHGTHPQAGSGQFKQNSEERQQEQNAAHESKQERGRDR
jgi:hypothetical protein